MSLTIRYDRRASCTAAFAIMAEAWHEMVQEGLTPDNVGSPPIYPDSEVLYAVGPDGDIVGVMVWHRDERTGHYHVTLGYVEPSSRRQGVFTSLFEALRKFALESGVQRIVTVTAGHQSVVAVLSGLGGVRTQVTYEHRVA